MAKITTHKQALAMQGTEFTFFYENGDTIQAYVKKIDSKTGEMSCWTFSLVTDQGFEFKPINRDEEVEGAFCILVGFDWADTKNDLKQIAKGEYRYNPGRGGLLSCIFS